MNKRSAAGAQLALPILLTMSLISGTSHAAVSGTQPSLRIKNETYTENSGWANPELAHAAAESGRVLISHLRAARAFLADGSAAGARNELIVAQDFSAALKHDMPFLEVSKSIRNAQQKLISGNTKIAYDDLLPIYASLDDMQVYAPELARQERHKIKHAETQARSGKTHAAAQALTDAANELETTTVYLPLDHISKEIRLAQTALHGSHPDLKSAQQSVNNALDSLVAEKVHVLAFPNS